MTSTANAAPRAPINGSNGHGPDSVRLLPDHREPTVAVHPGAPSVSVVVPAMNEEGNIGWVMERIPPCASEVIVVDGYSSDRTVQEARASRPDVIGVPQRGRGKGAALRTGFERATGD
jgi:cellulose synthase/poly-beta-1,6-N-acetylglucosamine synthase-like glycosyltransferase